MLLLQVDELLPSEPKFLVVGVDSTKVQPHYSVLLHGCLPTDSHRAPCGFFSANKVFRTSPRIDFEILHNNSLCTLGGHISTEVAFAHFTWHPRVSILALALTIFPPLKYHPQYSKTRMLLRWRMAFK